MHIYFATPKRNVISKLAKQQPDYKPNILLSYASKNSDTHSLLTTARHLSDSIILDSGTWTLHECKEENRYKITIGGYEGYLKMGAGQYDYYFNFDESFAEDNAFETNSEHQERLEATGFKPIYVLHSTSGEEVEYCLKQKYEYVAVGSSSLTQKEATTNIVNLLFEKGFQSLIHR